LSEILVGTAILAVIGVTLITMVQAGARGAGRAGEEQLAAILAGRLVDRVVTEGFSRHEMDEASPRSVDLGTLRDAGEPEGSDAGVLDLDGVAFRASTTIALVSPDLLRVLVTIS